MTQGEMGDFCKADSGLGEANLSGRGPGEQSFQIDPVLGRVLALGQGRQDAQQTVAESLDQSG